MGYRVSEIECEVSVVGGVAIDLKLGQSYLGFSFDGSKGQNLENLISQVDASQEIAIISFNLLSAQGKMAFVIIKAK